jgi:purine-nucleoside phosphorylase
VQILLDTFDIERIVHYGTSGSANSSLYLGDVSVPSYVAFTGSWKWKVQIYHCNVAIKMKKTNLFVLLDFTSIL